MTQEEKLKEIILFVAKNNFDWYNCQTCLCTYRKLKNNKKKLLKINKIKLEHINDLIFSHSFLKAFFGKNLVNKNGNILSKERQLLGENHNLYYYAIERWKYYAKELILLPEEERIDYLYDFIKGEKSES